MKTKKAILVIVASAFGSVFWPGSAIADGPVTATGGNIIYDIQKNNITYRVHIFTNTTGSASLTVSNGGLINCLLVGGGGGGGETVGGGGGGGGVIEVQNATVTSGVYKVTVGAGGIPGWDGVLNTYPAGYRGDDSSFNIWTALGGGAGAGYTVSATKVGGSAGGDGGGLGKRAGYTVGQGYDGAGNWAANAGGGGGGAGAAGTAGSSVSGGTGGTGGNGRTSSITGTLAYYGGGGGGGLRDTMALNVGVGGLGGGGNGGRNTAGVAGLTSTGGGGGGGGFEVNGVKDKAGGRGGSGIVIISYSIATGTIIRVR